MNTHREKILPIWYADTEAGIRNFFITRYNEAFAIGDLLIIEDRSCERSFMKRIGYIHKADGSYGLYPNMCILGLQEVQNDRIR